MTNETEYHTFENIDAKSLTNENGKHAIVIGGGISGLLAARVLADFFEHVTIIERDHYPETPAPRSGVPQANHIHVLLQRGFMIASELFPTLAADLKAQGAFSTTPTEPPILSINPYGKSVHGPINMEFIFAERSILEWCIYHQLIRRPEIHIRTGWDVTDFIAIAQKREQVRVIGVRMRKRGTESRVDSLNADFVVDASGRNSPLLNWLQQRNVELPPEENVTSGLGYATRYYKQPEKFAASWHVLQMRSDPPHNPRTGLLCTVRPGIWQVSLGGIAGHHPPTDEAGFQQWLRDLITLDLYNVLQEAEPISPIRGFRTSVSYLRHFDQMNNAPKGIIGIGDSLCAFNPIYGQGMSAAAIEAQVLQTLLQKSNGEDLEQHYYQEAIQAIRPSWWWSVIEDLRWPDVMQIGLQEMGDVSLAQQYLDQVGQCMMHDQEVAMIFTQVQGMMLPLQALFAPEIAEKVLRSAFPLVMKESIQEIAVSA